MGGGGGGGGGGERTVDLAQKGKYTILNVNKH